MDRPPSPEAAFALPPPAPPERRTALRVILVLTAAAHVAVLAIGARSPAVVAAKPAEAQGDRIVVLRGEVTTTGAEAGLHLHGYAEVPAPR
jgi:hypothetical protein